VTPPKRSPRRSIVKSWFVMAFAATEFGQSS
jgi:hypothetical protein